MTRAELQSASEQLIRAILVRHLPPGTAVWLFGSRARQTAPWHADYDLWIDAEVPRQVLANIQEELEESIVPFPVDLVTTQALRGAFGERVRAEAVRWM